MVMKFFFKDVMISNAENNSDSVSLNDVQKSISVVLFHENTNHSALGMHNCSCWPRIMLLSVISALQWLEYDRPARTPSPTPVPTPSPTPVPTATPSATLAPTCLSAFLQNLLLFRTTASAATTTFGITTVVAVIKSTCRFKQLSE